MLRFEDLIAGALGCRTPACSANRRSADAPHCIIYTSGTESRPKGCLHTLNTITFTVHALGGQAMAMGPGDVMFMPSPITHATGLAMGVIAPLMLGAGIHGWTSGRPRRPAADRRAPVHDEHDGGALRVDDLDRCSAIPRRPPGWPPCRTEPAPARLARRSCSAASRRRYASARCCRSTARSEGLLSLACTAGDRPSTDEQPLRSGRAVPGAAPVDIDEGRQASRLPCRRPRRDLLRHAGPHARLLADPEATAASIDDRRLAAFRRPRPAGRGRATCR